MNKLERIEALEAEIKKLKAEFSEPEFKKGWYSHRNEVWYLIYRTNEYHYGDTYGICLGEFRTDLSFDKYHKEEFRPATESEVFEALKKEAIKRGFKEGVRVKCAQDNTEWTLQKDISIECFSYRSNTITDGSGAYWFYEGKWAEIIDEPFKVCGYEVKKDGNYYKIGCKKIHYLKLKDLKDMMTYDNFKTVQFDEYKVTLEEINKILEL